MHEEALNQPMKMDVMQVPSAAQSQQVFGEARRMYMRVLAGWASDALVLRRAGLDQAAWSVSRPMRRAA